jgi:hypothetical protein
MNRVTKRVEKSVNLATKTIKVRDIWIRLFLL